MEGGSYSEASEHSTTKRWRNRKNDCHFKM